MPEPKPTILIREHQGQEVMSPDALALLFGVSADDISAHMKTLMGGRLQSMVSFPQTWLQAGRRRINEASAAIGNRDLLGILQYWAEKDRDSVIVLVDEDGQPC